MKASRMSDAVWFCRGLPEHLRSKIGDLRSIGPDLGARVDAAAVLAGGEPYSADILDLLPELKHIARVGIGVDGVDLEAATERGVIVTNTPEGPTTSTAEHTIALMMAVAHELTPSAQRLRRAEGDYVSTQNSMELAGRVLGLIGYGRIGRAVAHMAEAIGMHVIVSDPVYDGTVAVNDLLARADVVSLHVPATPETFHMIDEEALHRMKRGSILVNCARGSVVSSEDLVAALQSGHLVGAGLDVTDPEPLDSDHPLLHMENVIVTPHVASNTTAGRERMERMAFEQVQMVFKGERPTNLVNPLVWKD